MYYKLILFMLISLHICCQPSADRVEEHVIKQEVLVGAAQFDQYVPLISQKRIALVVNQTSRVGDRHLVDTLQSLNLDIQRIFAPEHGFRGSADAGALIEDGVDKTSGLLHRSS